MSRSDTPANDMIPQFIDDQQSLNELCARIREAERFAFDTEFVMEDRFVPEVCVVQLATDRLVAVVDPLKGLSLDPVWDLVADTNLEVILHAGLEDLALCATQGGRTPARVFDCQVACGLVGPDYPLSLSRMVRAQVGIRLHKSQTLTDWRRRPLTPEQLQYAAEDVAHLPAVHRALDERLRHLGRRDWMEEEMGRFTDARTYERNGGDNVLRLKGAGALDAKGLAIARELLRIRQELALQYDRPVRAVVRDHLLVEIARHRWTTSSQIRTLRGLHLRRDGIQALADAVKRAESSPRESWPVVAPASEESDQEASVCMLVGALVRAWCARNGLSQQLVASKADVHGFVVPLLRGREPDPGQALARGWRGRTVGALARDLLAGRVRLSVGRNSHGPEVSFD